jgi:hypothetical protein
MHSSFLFIFVLLDIMRFFIYILVIYFLAIIAMPCVDVHNECSMHKRDLSTTSQNNHPAEDNKCSPFCTCDCCVSPVISQYSIFELTITLIILHNYPEYNQGFISFLFSTIWQPPKIS